MHREIERAINESNGNEVRLHGHIVLHAEKADGFTVGRLCVKGLINVMRSDIVIDGSNAFIEAEIEDCTMSDCCLFLVHPSARNVHIKNLRVKVKIRNGVASRMFSLIYNTSYGFKMNNCLLEMYADKQVSLTGIYNNGNLDTHMNTRADNFAVNDCSVTAECRAEECDRENAVYGIYNYLANSIAVTNTLVYVVNNGVGEKQRAVGVYTNGRFGRFVGNNIKANGTHNAGVSKEQAHAFGFRNDGMYTILSSNNLIAEWAGMCVGLENNGEQAVIASNKILATHTICGRCIRNYGDGAKIEGNVLTSTSRNARLLEQNARDCIVMGNGMDVLMVASECKSGCGIYGVGERNERNTIIGNCIRNVTDCGIFADDAIGTVSDNLVLDSNDAPVRAGTGDRRLAIKLDERNIRSL